MRVALALVFTIFPLALTQADATGALPPAVASRVAEDKKTCDSGPVTLKPGFLTQKDINGDGRPDYILNYEHFLCAGSPSFCGSGGCSMVVFASRLGTYVRVLDDLGGKIDFMTVGGKPALTFLQRSGKWTMIWNGETFRPVH